MTEEEEKAAFAALLLKSPQDPFKAACALFPDNTNRALRVAVEWANDPIVKELKTKLIETSEGGELAFLPSKADFARAVWERMQSEFDTENFTKLGKLYAEVRGFIAKPEPSVVVNTQTDNRVMVVKDMGTDEEWESKAANQQRKLLNVSTSKH